MRILVVLIGLLLIGGAAGRAQKAAAPALTDISIIPIHAGINIAPRFSADGRAATIVKAWRENGNAHGYNVYIVTLPLNEEGAPQSPTGVVAFDTGPHPLMDTVTDQPFDGERVLGTVRFARAKLDGKPAVVMIRADLGEAMNGVVADHAPVDISVYQLRHLGIDVGTTPDVFKLISKTRPAARFCNADMALSLVLRLPLPSDYAGGGAPSGCLD